MIHFIVLLGTFYLQPFDWWVPNRFGPILVCIGSFIVIYFIIWLMMTLYWKRKIEKLNHQLRWKNMYVSVPSVECLFHWWYLHSSFYKWVRVIFNQYLQSPIPRINLLYASHLVPIYLRYNQSLFAVQRSYRTYNSQWLQKFFWISVNRKVAFW